MYTARFGTPGRFRGHDNSMPDVDRFYFTDVDMKEGCHQMIPVKKDREIKNDFYNVKRMNLDHISMPIKRQRYVKIYIPDEIFDNYEYSIYVDTKRPVFIDFEWWLSHLKDDSDFLIRQHPARDCAYAEAAWLIKKGWFDEANISRQVEFYKKDGFPPHNGLYYSAHIFRRHTKALREFSKLWWKQIEEFSYRDQISLPYAVWKHNVKVSFIPRRR